MLPDNSFTNEYGKIYPNITEFIRIYRNLFEYNRICLEIKEFIWISNSYSNYKGDNPVIKQKELFHMTNELLHI